MKVLLVAPRLPPQFDGVGDHAHALACALRAEGHDVRAITTSPASEQTSYSLQVLGATWGLRTTIAALRVLRSMRPDLVLVEYTPFLYGAASLAPALIAIACRALRIPCTVIAHEILYAGGSASIPSSLKGWFLTWRDAAVLRAAAHIVVANRERSARIETRVPRAAARVRIVPIAANVEPGAIYVRNPQHTALQLVSFGVVMKRRRYEIAIRALAELRKRRSVHLTIVGRIFDSGYAEDCAVLAREIGVGDCLTFTGSVSSMQVSRYLGRADIGIHTASEGCTRSSGSLLALLAHAVPVVAVRSPHDDPCFADVVLRVDEDPHALSTTLLALAREPARAEELGRHGQRVYRATFDWRAVARTLIAS